MIDVEVLGAGRWAATPPPREVRRLCELTAARMGVERAHVAIEFVDAERIAQLNGDHRNKPVPTDVLSFPIDGVAAHSPTAVPIELGDVVICPEHTVDVREAVVHGMLHLLGMDHETDHGEMLALQRELLAGADG
jgi:probable rRNA maturation factor